MKTRKNESTPSRMVRETGLALCFGFFALLAGVAAGGAVYGLGLLIGVQATVGLVGGLGIGSALILFRDWLS